MMQRAHIEKAIDATLRDVAAANVETGVLLLCKEALVTAIQDSRLHRGHLRVLAAIATFMSTKTAKAWPGRTAIAALLGMPPKSVSNLLLELRNLGYLIADREVVPEANNRNLMVYTFGKIDHETIRREITSFINGVREGRIPYAKVPPQRDTQSPALTGQSRPSGTFETEKVPPQRVGKSRPNGDSNSKKELTTFTNVKEAQAPEAIVSFKAAIWQHGLRWLNSIYQGSIPEREVRSRLGLLVKNHGQGLVLDAMGKADDQKAIDPLDFMTAVLTRKASMAKPVKLSRY